MDIFYNFISLCGIVVFVLLAYATSAARSKINWHIVMWGVSLQLMFAWFLFVFPSGIKFFLWVNNIVIKVLESSLAGAQFVFGDLAVPPGMESGGTQSFGFILAFQAFPTIIFFSALMSILYFFRIMPKLIKGFARLFTRLMKVSGAESLCAASNIFVGVESALTVKPFLKNMTRSELCTVLTAGLATVSSNVLAVYVFSLRETFPNIAGHLVCASFLSAPAALAMSKMVLPETGDPETLGENPEVHYEKEDSLFEAVINGANAGVKLIVGIVALLIAVLGLVALCNQFIGFLGEGVNRVFPAQFSWSLESMLGVIFYPLTLVMGMPPADAGVLSRIIGERIIVTELVSYQHLADVLKDNLLLQRRSAVIAAYALCGFAHIASLSIFIGGIAALVPERTRDLSRVGFRALWAATLACLLTGCVAGVFFTQQSFLLGS